MSDPPHAVDAITATTRAAPPEHRTRPLRVLDDGAGDGDDRSSDAGLFAGRLFVRDVRGEIVPVHLALVERLEAQDDYVSVVTRERRYLIAARLGELADQLRAHSFLRVHRSHVVNLDYVERMVPYDSKRLEVRLRDGTRILASRVASEMIRRRAR